MNRVNLRREAKELAKKDKTLNMTVGSFETSLTMARKDEREKTINFVVRCYTAALSLVMHDKWGFGKKRLNRLAKQVNNIFESFLTGDISLSDVEGALNDEGIILRIEDK